MNISQRYSPSLTKNSENGYSYFNCNCCPYGYHIDLDFVRYCESISQEADRSGSIKRRKDRRRQRQSMEVLLGITPPLLANEQNYKSIIEQEAPKLVQKTNFPLFHHDGFNDAVSDFERTLQRSKNKLSNNLPDVTAVSATDPNMTVLATTTDGRSVNHDFDNISIESNNINSLTLQNIREQMALSLERTKQLEIQVKLIPGLENELMALKEENRRLMQKLKKDETTQLKNNANYINTFPYNRLRSHSFTHIDDLDSLEKKITPPTRKDIGVMCGVLTRHIGVGHQAANMKTVSTATTLSGKEIDSTTDKWLNEKIKFMNNQNLLNSYDKFKLTKTTQTPILNKEQKEIGVQTKHQQKIDKINNYTQTYSDSRKFNTKNICVQTIPTRLIDFSAQKVVECYSIGCSDDTINQVICEKCNAFKRSVGVGPDNNDNPLINPINLSSLTMPRSKSFNLGGDKLNLSTKNRTVACQYEPFDKISRGIQSEKTKTHSKYCQHESKCAEKNTQCEKLHLASKLIDTKDLIKRKNVECEAKEIIQRTQTKDIGCNTTNLIQICNKCMEKDSKDDLDVKKDENPTPSRIPRPQIPTTPVEVRKFRRQDTYTKIYSTPESKSPVSPVPRLSGLDLSSKAISNETNPIIDKVKENLKFSDGQLPSAASPENEVNTSAITKINLVQDTTLPLSETTLFQSQNPNRKKATPSKEMQGAMKVLNDAIQKNPYKTVTHTSAINIVQKEWFKISSTVQANPLDVEDYLDAFEEMSSILLQYIVNMSDSSGNTAMHYAVSHGNFDVVSILLDSKVCDINKTNKAGYTSVMLVSLAEVRSKTHANVVKRLFQLADVNIRAKQHGQTALMLAVSHGRLDMVVMLLEAGADINIQDEDGSTALMCAAEHGHIEIVKHFLNQPDCDSSITDVDGSTALKIAMEAGHKHIGVLLYAHERNYQKIHGTKLKKTKSLSPKTPSSPLPIRSSQRALTDIKTPK